MTVLRNPRRLATMITLAVTIGATMTAYAARAQSDDKHPVVVLDTTYGPITIELDKEKVADHGRELLEVCRRRLL